MIGDIAILDIVEREHMIILHLEMAAIIVECSACLPVVRRINVKPAVKHIGRGVCHIITREKITWFHTLNY